VVVIEHDDEPGQEALRVVAADDMRQLVREHGTALASGPRSPVARKQEDGPLSAGGGWCGEISHLAQRDGPATAHRAHEFLEQAGHLRVIDPASAPAAKSDGPETKRHLEQSRGDSCERDAGEGASPVPEAQRGLGRAAT
jgi:hypothetical protein